MDAKRDRPWVICGIPFADQNRSTTQIETSQIIENSTDAITEVSRRFSERRAREFAALTLLTRTSRKGSGKGSFGDLGLPDKLLFM
jgi:hypothetical protein